MTKLDLPGGHMETTELKGRGIGERGNNKTRTSLVIEGQEKLGEETRPITIKRKRKKRTNKGGGGPARTRDEPLVKTT